MTTATSTLAETVEAANAAEEAARKATAAAEQARQRAAEAKAQAEAERKQANIRYLELLVAEHTEARKALLERQGEARDAFEAAVRGEDGDIFVTYRDWTRAAQEAWAEEHALANQRIALGQPTRDPNPPVFSFAHDVAAVLDHHVLTVGDEITERWRERRAAFLNGATQ